VLVAGRVEAALRSPLIATAALIVFLAVLNARTDAQVAHPPPGKTQTYYIAADEVVWDYSPRFRNVTALPAPEEELEGRSAAGKKYLKAIYREYTDATFETLKPRATEWEHLGILGPLIRAEVGDTVKVVFRNKTKILYYCSMHPHGLAYAKNSEGAMYNDGAGVERGSPVQPGRTYTYTWYVPESAGPGPDDPSSILWMYHSHFNEDQEINAGLLGPIIVSRRGSTKPDGTPRDVDREFITAFAIFSETESPYFDRKRYPPNVNVEDPNFRKLNLLYTINGLIRGNLPMMTMKKGERVRWYLLANSNEDDVHAVHWHGQTVISNHMRTDVVNLGPMTMAVADMVPENVGTWLLHCHVNEHLRGGMTALFTVAP
jgi:manganese oxidase